MLFDLSLFNKRANYAEEFQKMPLVMSLCNIRGMRGKIQPRYTPVQCRDFLCDDFVWSLKKAFETTIYRFTLPTKEPLQTDQIRIMIKTSFNPDKDRLNYVASLLDGCQPLLIEVEPDVYYIEMSNNWYKSTVHLSLLTFLLKHCFYHTEILSLEQSIQKYDENFHYYFKDIECVMNNLKDFPDLGPENSINKTNACVHDFSGFLSTIRPHTAEFTVYGPHVQKLLKKNKKKEKLCAA